MKKNIKQFISNGVIVIAFMVALASCNKDLPGATPITFPISGSSLGTVINTDPNFTFFKAAVARAGLTILSDSVNRSFTAYIPNDAAFIASGFPTAAAVTALPVATAQGIVNYSIVPGEVLASTDIPTTFPNMQLPTLQVIGVLPGTSIPVTLFTFPSRRAGGFWVNNIPAATLDQRVSNGIIHIMQRVVSPPAITTLKGQIYTDPQMSLFVALIARGDSGQAAASKFDSILNNALANLTVFAPTNAGITATYGITTTAQIAGLPVINARGIVAYHILGSRAFSVNFGTTATTYTTLLGAVPSLTVQATLSSGFGAALQVTGAANGGIAANATAPTNLDKHVLNGVEHIIDRALKPF